MYERIIIPTDGSEPSKEAVKQGLELAKATGVKVLALYVMDTTAFAAIPPDSLTTDIYSLLNKAAHETVNYVVREGKRIGVYVETKIVEGVPSEQIIENSGPNDLIVLGTKGRTGLEKILLGSVAENVVHHASCPVMVVRKSD
jgi:nucleotide-binding universal stress UspA family protein